MTVKISDIGEKELVKYIISNSKDITPDDASVTPIKTSNLISTCDMLIQSKHFPKNMSYFEMGFKAVTVNVSDLAAMGAKPAGFLLALGLPKNLLFDSFKEIINGVLEACEFYSIPLIGGDTNESDEIIMTGTALGTCNRPLMKNTYNHGDLIALTGDIGHAALGFNLDKSDNIYVKKALKPIAKIKEGLILKDIATSATDITDGLASELYEIKKENYGFMIYEDSLKITDEYKNLACECDLNFLDLILYVGEDFELLFTISPDDLDKLPFDYIIIGEVTDSNRIEITLNDRSVLKIQNKGYEHYR